MSKTSSVIGTVQVVNGFVFTLVDKEDKNRFLVEITQEGTDFSELEIVAHNTWGNGKFKKFFDKMFPKEKKAKKVGERKPRTRKPIVINGVKFLSEKIKGTTRVIVWAEGYEGTYEMSESAWYRKRFFKNIMKVLKRIVDTFLQGVEKNLLPACTTVTRSLAQTAKDIYDLANVRYRKELKETYKRLARKFHPDHGGDENMFKKIAATYEKRNSGLSSLEYCTFGLVEDNTLTFEEAQELYDGLYDVYKEEFGY